MRISYVNMSDQSNTHMRDQSTTHIFHHPYVFVCIGYWSYTQVQCTHKGLDHDSLVDNISLCVAVI